MNTWFKRGLIISGLLIAVGIGMGIGGVALGGLEGNVVGMGFTTILQNNTHGTSPNTSTTQEEHIVLEPFTAIEADIDTLSIKIVEGDSYHMTIQNNSNYLVEYRLIGDVLEVKHEVGPWNNTKGNEGEIIITVPLGITLNTIDLEQGVGEVSLQKVNAKEVEIEAGMGDILLENTVIQNLNIEGGMGSISSKGLTCYALDIEAGMGDVDLQGSFLGDVVIEGGMGDITLRTTEAHTQYNYAIERGLGTVTMDDAVHDMMSGDIQEQHNADKTIRIEAGMGDIVIESGMILG